jgi:steroid delta-isomerase-like uncharacterized protein
MSADVVSSTIPLITMDAAESIVRSVVIALNKEQISDAIDQFADRFTFTDHALGLEFTEKERLIDFFRKSRELQPDASVKIVSSFQAEDNIAAEWEFTATQEESSGYFCRRLPICLQGVTVAQVKDGRITRWSDFYDQVQSRRVRLAALFRDWIEY